MTEYYNCIFVGNFAITFAYQLTIFQLAFQQQSVVKRLLISFPYCSPYYTLHLQAVHYLNTIHQSIVITVFILVGC